MPEQLIWVSASGSVTTGSGSVTCAIPGGQWILEKYAAIVSPGDGYGTVTHLKEGQTSSFVAGIPFFPAKNFTEGEPFMHCEGGQSIRFQCAAATTATTLGLTLWLRKVKA